MQWEKLNAWVQAHRAILVDIIDPMHVLDRLIESGFYEPLSDDYQLIESRKTRFERACALFDSVVTKGCGAFAPLRHALQERMTGFPFIDPDADVEVASTFVSDEGERYDVFRQGKHHRWLDVNRTPLIRGLRSSEDVSSIGDYLVQTMVLSPGSAVYQSLYAEPVPRRRARLLLDFLASASPTAISVFRKIAAEHFPHVIENCVEPSDEAETEGEASGSIPSSRPAIPQPAAAEQSTEVEPTPIGENSRRNLNYNYKRV